jgi:hypothetical protein
MAIAITIAVLATIVVPIVIDKRRRKVRQHRDALTAATTAFNRAAAAKTDLNREFRSFSTAIMDGMPDQMIEEYNATIVKLNRDAKSHLRDFDSRYADWEPLQPADDLTASGYAIRAQCYHSLADEIEATMAAKQELLEKILQDSYLISAAGRSNRWHVVGFVLDSYQAVLDKCTLVFDTSSYQAALDELQERANTARESAQTHNSDGVYKAHCALTEIECEVSGLLSQYANLQEAEEMLAAAATLLSRTVLILAAEISDSQAADAPERMARLNMKSWAIDSFLEHQLGPDLPHEVQLDRLDGFIRDAYGVAGVNIDQHLLGCDESDADELPDAA